MPVRCHGYLNIKPRSLSTKNIYNKQKIDHQVFTTYSQSFFTLKQISSTQAKEIPDPTKL